MPPQLPQSHWTRLVPSMPTLSFSLMQELTTIFNHASLFLMNSGTPYLLLYLHLPMTWTYFRERFQYISFFWLSLGSAHGLVSKWAFLFNCFCSLAQISTLSLENPPLKKTTWFTWLIPSHPNCCLLLSTFVYRITNLSHLVNFISIVM